MKKCWVLGILSHAHFRMRTHMLVGHNFNLQEMIWAVLFTQDFLQLRGECARSISFSFLLDLFISCQLCSYVYYGNLLFSSPPLFYAFTPSLRTLLLCCRCRCTQFNFSAAAMWGKGLEGGRYREVEGREKGKSQRMRGVGRAQQVDGFKTSSFFLSFKDIIIGAWCSSAHQDMAWVSFSASGSSRVEYILTRSDRRTGFYTQELELELLPLEVE